MKKLLFLCLLCIVSFNVIHAEITWKLSDDGTLTISGTDMPDYYFDYNIAQGSDAPWIGNKDKIKKIVIEDGVTNIGSGAFYYCPNLTSITISNSVTSIGRYAFKWCSELTSVTLGNSVTSIGEEAFYSCTGLTSIIIPESVTSIGDEAFDGCI